MELHVAGWSSNSKYSLLGGLRSSAQMISYELSMGLSLLAVVMMVSSFSLNDMVAFQKVGAVGNGISFYSQSDF